MHWRRRGACVCSPKDWLPKSYTSVDKNKGQDVFSKAGLLPVSVCLSLTMSFPFLGRWSLREVSRMWWNLYTQTPESSLMMFCFFQKNQSKAREKIYTDGQRELYVGWGMWELSDKSRRSECTNLKRMRANILSGLRKMSIEELLHVFETDFFMCKQKIHHCQPQIAMSCCINTKDFPA